MWPPVTPKALEAVVHWCVKELFVRESKNGEDKESQKKRKIKSNLKYTENLIPGISTVRG